MLATCQSHNFHQTPLLILLWFHFCMSNTFRKQSAMRFIDHFEKNNKCAQNFWLPYQSHTLFGLLLRPTNKNQISKTSLQYSISNSFSYKNLVADSILWYYNFVLNRLQCKSNEVTAFCVFLSLHHTVWNLYIVHSPRNALFIGACAVFSAECTTNSTRAISWHAATSPQNILTYLLTYLLHGAESFLRS